MIDKDWTFVLGAQDPEMREMERVLRHAQRPYAIALHGGRRCQPKTAYLADTAQPVGRGPRSAPLLLLPDAPLVMVECSLAGHEPVLRIDHHHPGDPGYTMGPERYLEGSSLGQVLLHLEMEADSTQRLLAAADHCLTAAYRGICPGVDPHELLFLRAAWQAKMSGRSLGDLVAGILAAARQVERHFDSELGEALFLDPTTVPRDLPEGSAYTGRPVRYRQWTPGGDIKEMLKGATPEHITRFMAEHAAAGRVVYGNPWRGYAGAYY